MSKSLINKEFLNTPDSSEIGFVPLGTGAVATTVQAKLRESVSAADFGASGTLVLNVPATYATIQAAFTYLADVTIAANTTVQIKVADGTYTLASGINANHPQGSQIQVIGNTTTPANCVITVSGVPTFDAFVVSNGNTLGYLNGFMFTLASKATSVNNYTAILANNGANLLCGPNITTNNWYYGISARNGSFISCDFASINNAGDVGIWSFVGSTVYCRNASSTNASDVTNNLGFGFQAEYGSAMDCSNATASGCLIGGIASLSGSTVRAWSAISNNNTGSGFYAFENGVIENHNATANTNTRYGEERVGGGVVLGNSVTLTGNTISSTSGYAYLDNSGSLGARLVANGDLRIDTNSANQTYFNSSGGIQLKIQHTAASVAYPIITGSATSPSISSGGTATNIDLNLKGKGTGSVFIANNNVNYVRINPAATTVSPVIAAEGETNLDLGIRGKGTGSILLGSNALNYVRINPTATTVSPAIFPEGETNLDLILGSKGTGLVRFGVYTANADVACNGWITVKDFAGTTRKLMTTA